MLSTPSFYQRVPAKYTMYSTGRAASRGATSRKPLAQMDLSGNSLGNKGCFVILSFRKYRGKYTYLCQQVRLAAREKSGGGARNFVLLLRLRFVGMQGVPAGVSQLASSGLLPALAVCRPARREWHHSQYSSIAASCHSCSHLSAQSQACFCRSGRSFASLVSGFG